jgi:hypothetical protein
MGDKVPATKADLNNLMTRMDAMMAAMESQKSQLDALTSGTSSTNPPILVETSDKDKPSLNEDDPDKDGNESNEDPPKKDDTSQGHSTEIPHPTSYVFEDTFKCHTLLHAAHRHHLMLLALPIGKITCALT